MGTFLFRTACSPWRRERSEEEGGRKRRGVETGTDPDRIKRGYNYQVIYVGVFSRDVLHCRSWCLWSWRPIRTPYLKTEVISAAGLYEPNRKH